MSTQHTVTGDFFDLQLGDTCKINDADCSAGREVKSRGLCSAHYQRWWRGNFAIVPDPPIVQVRCGMDNPNWSGDDIGYVARHERVYRARGKADRCINGCVTTSRYEWAHIHGTDPLDINNYQPMCKRCHTQYDSAKLTWEKVEEIRALAYFGVKQVRLAEMYDTCQGNISDIVNGKIWIPQPVCTEALV